MIDFHWTELIVIMLVTLLVVGPKDLPKVMRGFGAAMHKIREMAGDFRRGLDQLAEESELDSIAKEGQALREGLDVGKPLRRGMDADGLPDLPRGPRSLLPDESPVPPAESPPAAEKPEGGP